MKVGSAKVVLLEMLPNFQQRCPYFLVNLGTGPVKLPSSDQKSNHIFTKNASGTFSITPKSVVIFTNTYPWSNIYQYLKLLDYTSLVVSSFFIFGGGRSTWFLA